MYIQENIVITPDIAKRLIALTNVRVAIPVSPLPGERLADIIFRAASVNGFSTSAPVMPWLTRVLSHRFIARSSVPISALADSLGVPCGASDLEGIRYPRYDRDGTLQPYDTSSKNARFGFFGTILPCNQLITGRRVSPSGLERSSHSRAIWHLAALGFDPENFEVLLDRCPFCNEQLDFHFACGVSGCVHCGPRVDLRRCAPKKVEHEDTDALSFVASLVDPDKVPQTSGLHDDLCSLAPGELFMLCATIGAVLEGRKATSYPERRRALFEGAVAPAYIAAAGRALLDWPEGFAKIANKMNADPVWGKRRNNVPPIEDFLQQERIFSRSTWQAVRQVSLLQEPNRATAAEASPSHVRNKAPINESLQFAGRRSNAVLLFSQMSGLPAGVLADCLMRGSIAVPYASGDGLSAHIEVELERIARSSQKPDPDRPCIGIKETVSALFRGLGNPWSETIAAIADGRLPTVKTEKLSGLWIDSLSVQSFEPWRRFCAELIPDTSFVDLPLFYPDAAFHLGIKTSMFRVIMSQISSERRAKTLRKLSEFRAEYMTVHELVSRLAIEGSTTSHQRVLRALARLGIAKREGRSGLRLRTEVEAAFPELLRSGRTARQR